MSASASATMADTPPRIDSTRLITLEEGWSKIYHDGIVKLQNIIQEGVHKGFTNKEYMDLYTTIYQMCIQKAPHCYTPQLYERYELAINEYLQSTALPAITNKSNEFLVKEFVRRWDDHKLMKQWLFDFFRYLDRFFVKRHGKKPLKEVAISRFRVLIFEQVKQKVVLALLELIKRDRNGDEVDRDLLRDAITIFVEMGMGTHKVYTMEFEKPFIKATNDYYGREAANWLASDSCPEYLRKAEGRFMEEKKRLEDYLHSSSEAPLLETLNQCLLIQHQSAILEKENTGLRVMLKTHAENDLARLYQLYSGIHKHLQPIANIVQKHIEDIGNTLIDKVNAEQNASTYIEELMKIHQTDSDLVRTCFQGNTIFQRALKDAFEVIVNKATFQSSTAELLATFADNILLKGGVKLTEKELETTLDNVVRLFTYLTDKDFFSEFYRKQLATRLLMQRSASTDAEKSMIGRLKLACGAQFTSKLEGMIMDMAQAHDHQGELKAFLTSNMVDLHGIDFTVQTLTTGFWPTYPMDEIKLPPEMNKCLDSFRVYYDKKTSNRRLRWIHDLGVVTLQANFTKGRRDLVVSTVQAAILMLFNEMEEYSIDELIKHTGLEADVMKQQLKSLVSGKFKILLKKPSEGYATNHRIRVNQTFVHAQLRIRIPNAVRRTTDKDRAGAQLAVQEDRKHAIEAAIVRVMKARKTLNHQQLIGEVSAQLMQFFQPDPRAIKKRIEDLIAREYLERDKEQSNVYHYLA